MRADPELTQPPWPAVRGPVPVEPWISALVQNGLVGVVRSTVNGRLRYANEALAHLLEYDSPAAMMANGIECCYRRAEDRARLVEALRRDGMVQAFEAEFVTATGGSRHVLISAKLDGEEIAGVVVDITTRRGAELALARSEERYRNLVETMREAFVAMDMPRRVVAANPAAAALLGFPSAEAMVGVSVAAAYACPEERDAILRELEARGYADNFEITLNRQDGSGTQVRVLGSAVLRRDAGGEPFVVEAIFTDITERRRSETALRESEARYRAAEQQLRNIVEHSTNVFYAHSTDHILTYLSPQVRTVLDCEPEEALVRWTELLADNPVNQLGLAATQRAIATGIAQPPYELELRSLKGRSVWVEVHEAPVVRSGQTVEIVGSLTDITDRKAAEATLRRSEASYRQLVEHASHGIYRSSPEGRLLAVNPALVRMLAYASAEELMAVDLQDIYEDPGARGRLVEAYRNAEQIAGVDARWKRKDGCALIVRLSGQPVRDAAGRLECFEMIAEDVTQQRALERQLRQAQKMEAIGQLTGGIAHDFNNELSVIILNAQLVASALEVGGEVRPEDIRDIEDAAQRAASMTRQLLGFSRKADLTLAPTDLVRVATQLAGPLRRLVPETIDLRFVTEEAVPAVRADRGAVEQMLLNLITNARDAMPQGGRLEVGVSAVELTDRFVRDRDWGRPGEYVCLRVRDTGTGMDDETKSRIFEPFFTTKPVGVGTGLGLAMVYGLIKQHDGFVDVESAVGKGTTIRLYFPPTALAAVGTEPRHSGALAVAGTGTVLVVEDEDALRRVVRRVLERHGYRVLVAANGEEALQLFRAERDRIDVVVSDLVMPGMSGAKLYDALRTELEPGRFIVASGYAGRDADERKGLDPSVPFLQKPWRLDDLLGHVRRALGHVPPHTDPPRTPPELMAD